jgi:DNA-binding XRE family transcriptional regulator
VKPTKLREARESSGLTADEIAERAGCSRPTLYRIEAGEVQPKRPLARRLFEVYKRRVPLDHIYDPEFASEISPAR